MKIKKISLKMFRRFEELNVFCRDVNIFVGPNNAGKSTSLDALRICADVMRASKSQLPQLTNQGNHGYCATLSLSHAQVSPSIANICRNYSDEDAMIGLNHENGNRLIIKLNPDRAVSAYIVTDRAAPRSGKQFRDMFPIDIVVVPTLGPLEAEEKWVTDETVRRNESTRLAHRNFRNIWIRKNDDDFREFSNLIEPSWPSISVLKPEIEAGGDRYISMYFSENRVDREVHWSGFGFQIWMQIIMHILKGNEKSIIVIDEPDIYLHPDLQRKLFKILCSRFGQIFLATHSTEIINEADPGDILLISDEQKNAQRINSDDGYRKVFAYIGSSDNSEFARISRAKRVIFFEGKDRKILRKFAVKANKQSVIDNTDTVFLQAGGFGQWRRVRDVNWTLDRMFGMNVKIAAIFDRDFRCDMEISEFENTLASDNILCRVFRRKEIENYALNYDSIVRFVVERSASTQNPISGADVRQICPLNLLG